MIEYRNNEQEISEQGVVTPCSPSFIVNTFSSSKFNNEKFFHITWVTHNSRVSERMIKYKIEKCEWVYLSDEHEIKITWFIKDIVKEDNLKVSAYNICKDHIHLLLLCNEEKLSNIVRKVKWKSSQRFKEYLWVDKEEKNYLWAQKYNKSFIENEVNFNEVVKYIKYNREKHGLSVNKGLQPLVHDMLTHDILTF